MQEIIFVYFKSNNLLNTFLSSISEIIVLLNLTIISKIKPIFCLNTH